MGGILPSNLIALVSPLSVASPQALYQVIPSWKVATVDFVLVFRSHCRRPLALIWLVKHHDGLTVRLWNLIRLLPNHNSRQVLKSCNIL